MDTKAAGDSSSEVTKGSFGICKCGAPFNADGECTDRLEEQAMIREGDIRDARRLLARPDPILMREWGEWLDDPKNPLVTLDVSGLGVMTLGFFIRTIADAVAAHLPSKGEES